MHKESLSFGSGSFVGEVVRNGLPEDVRAQARVLGWAAGCPVVSELTDPSNQEPGRGAEAMVGRYGEVSFWFGYLSRATQEISPSLYNQLIRPVRRKMDEPAGKYEKESIPVSHLDEMSPLGTLAGYAIPRVFIEGLRLGENQAEVQDRLSRGLDIFNQAAAKAQNPPELLALFSEGMFKEGVPAGRILTHAYTTGWMVEHNARSMAGEVALALQANAPKLWDAYLHLSAADKSDYDIL